MIFSFLNNSKLSFLILKKYKIQESCEQKYFFFSSWSEIKTFGFLFCFTGLDTNINGPHTTLQDHGIDWPISGWAHQMPFLKVLWCPSSASKSASNFKLGFLTAVALTKNTKNTSGDSAKRFGNYRTLKFEISCSNLF